MTETSLICIAYHFPPSSATGGHRTRAIARHLRAFGWNPVVVTVKDDPDEGRDPSLLDGLPNDLVVYRTVAPMLLGWATAARSLVRRSFGSRHTARPSRATRPEEGRESEGARPRPWIDRASWWIQVPDRAIGWLPVGLATALHALRRHHGLALYSSAPCWTAHLIAMLAKKLSGRPWIADFRDPWRSNPFRRLPYRTVDRFDAWLETQVVNSADRVICNTRRIQADFEARFPELAGRFATIPNGFDPEKYEDLAAARPAGQDRLVITHAGEFYCRRRPHPIFEAIRLLRDRRTTSRQPVLHLIGTPTYEGRNLESIAAEFGVEDSVIVQGHAPHIQALEALRGSDVQLLVGFSGEGADLQVPAKLFEYLGVGRPILALAPRNSAIADIVAEVGGPIAICDPDDPEQIAAAIVELESRLNLGDGDRAKGVGTANSRFHRREQVGRLVELLDDVLRERGVEVRAHPKRPSPAVEISTRRRDEDDQADPRIAPQGAFHRGSL